MQHIGGTFDVVATRCDPPPPHVTVHTTLVCLTIICSSGQCLWPDLSRLLFPSSVGPGICSVSTPCDQLCRRHGCASLTADPTALSTSLPTCSQTNSQRCSTASYRQRPLLSGGIPPTPGLTRNVDSQSAPSDVWNGHRVFVARRKPPMPVTPSEVSIARFSGGNVSSSGGRRSPPRSRHRVNYGAPSTHCWAVAEYRRSTTSTLHSFIVCSMTRSPVYVHRRRFCRKNGWWGLSRNT